MAMVSHKTEAIYRRYAICDESMLKRVPKNSRISMPRRSSRSSARPKMSLGKSFHFRLEAPRPLE
jgi:hypothetical protein